MQEDNLVVVSVLNKTRAAPVYSHSLLCSLLLTVPAATMLLFSPVISRKCLPSISYLSSCPSEILGLRIQGCPEQQGFSGSFGTSG